MYRYSNIITSYSFYDMQNCFNHDPKINRTLLIVTVLFSAAGIVLSVFLAKLSISLLMVPDYEGFCNYRE
jgi:phage shock protein PspC (stress-responsive transcriptional regulator)